MVKDHSGWRRIVNRQEKPGHNLTIEMQGVGEEDHGGGDGVRIVQEVEHEQDGEQGHVQAAPHCQVSPKILKFEKFTEYQIKDSK